MTPAEAKQFWQTIARDEPEKAMALARECPKVAGRWRVTFTDEDGENWSRRLPERLDANAWGERWEISDDAMLIYCGDCDSLTAAQSACDAKLLELGYLLEPSE